MQVLIQKGGSHRKLASFSLWNDHPTTHYVIEHANAKTIQQAYKKASPPTILLSTTNVDITLATFLSKTSLYHKITKESVLCVFVCAINLWREREREREKLNLVTL
jgi:hypothetical protein